MLTPAFMPVGTRGTVKSLDLSDLVHIGVACLLGNTYHLHLSPGEDTVARLGGLHAFMGGWAGMILTDSGGYQIFSLARLRSIDESGVVFRAHTDGSLHEFTPESVVRIQELFGSDIMMVLDECPAHTVSREAAQSSAQRTARWAERSRVLETQGRGVLFGICHGAMYEDLRKESAEALAAMDFPGYAVGGLGIGEGKAETRRMLEASLSGLPESKPRYAMGIGAPDDIIDGVAAGVDMFDCVLQTREARNGGLLTRTGRLNITNARFTEDSGPIEEDCDCSTCRTYTRAYLHHLFRSRELLAYRLATIHNVRWTLKFMGDIRNAVIAGEFGEFRARFLGRYRSPDPALRVEQRKRFATSNRG